MIKEHKKQDWNTFLVDHILLFSVIIGYGVVVTMYFLPIQPTIQFQLTVGSQTTILDVSLTLWEFMFILITAGLGKTLLILYFILQVLPRIAKYWIHRIRRKGTAEDYATNEPSEHTEGMMT